MNSILERIREAKLFENCSALFLYLVKWVWNVGDIISAVANAEKEDKESAIIKSSITAFALGFFLGHGTYKFTENLLQKAVDEGSTEEDLLFAFHFMQLQKKLQTAGILPSGSAHYKS